MKDKVMDFTIDQLMIFAARSGNLPLLKERVEAGGDINYADSYHESALSAAILKGNIDVLDWLIANGVNINAEYHDGIGPLEIALKNHDSQIVYRLACAGAKLRKKTRPYYRVRLEQCIAEISANKK